MFIYMKYSYHVMRIRIASRVPGEFMESVRILREASMDKPTRSTPQVVIASPRNENTGAISWWWLWCSTIAQACVYWHARTILPLSTESHRGGRLCWHRARQGDFRWVLVSYWWMVGGAVCPTGDMRVSWWQDTMDLTFEAVRKDTRKPTLVTLAECTAQNTGN